MTICCGWLTADSAFVVADSVVTQTSLNNAKVEVRADTSFGEATITEPGRARYEGSIKVVQLSDMCVGVMTGDLGLATSALRAIHYRLGSDSIPEALNQERRRVDGSFSLLIVGHENGSPRLWHLADQQIHERYEPGAMIVIGSAVQDDSHMRWMTSVLERSVSGNPDHMLAAVLTGAQLRGQVKSAMQLGVGGAYFGAHVTGRLVHLSKDLLYIFVDQPIALNLSTSRAVLTGWRSGVAFTRVLTAAGTGHDERFVLLSSDIPDVSLSEMQRIHGLLKKTDTSPEYCVLVDQASGSYALIPASVRPDLVRVKVAEHHLELDVHAHAMQFAEGLFAEARRTNLSGFCLMGKGFPPEVEPDR
jgi:hypothetical protein